EAQPLAGLLDDGRAGGLPAGTRAQLLDEAGEGDAPRQFPAASQLDDAENIGQRLLAPRAKDEPRVGPGGLEEIAHGLLGGARVAAAMELAQETQGLHDWSEAFGEWRIGRGRGPVGMQAAPCLAVLQPPPVAAGEERGL